ncbi:MAG TPA: extracellular solute-binding protein [Candidatus Binatia bacterium]|jgi:iron(III) transport system substrate-binding protein
MKTLLPRAAFLLTALSLGCAAHAADEQKSWQAEWDRTKTAAEKEGEVAFYTLGDEYGYLKEFEKKFPKIRVKIVPGKGNDLLTRILAERRGGKYLADVARLGNTSPYTLYQAKALQPMPSAFILPEVKDETKWWQGKHHYADPEGKYIFVAVGSVSNNMAAYNTDLVNPSQIGSYWDILDKWKGKLVVMDPRVGGYGRSGARFVYYNPQLGPRYLQRLFAESDVTLARDYFQAIDWVATKKFSLVLFINGGDTLQAKDQGLPINVMDTGGWKEGAALEPGAFTFVAMDKPLHPNASKIFVNWLLSREGQAAIQKEGQTNDSLRIDIPKTEVRPFMRRRDGAKYIVTWTPEWMDTEPMMKVINQALGAGK